jgi:hypothetical protein
LKEKPSLYLSNSTESCGISFKLARYMSLCNWCIFSSRKYVVYGIKSCSKEKPAENLSNSGSFSAREKPSLYLSNSTESCGISFKLARYMSLCNWCIFSSRKYVVYGIKSCLKEHPAENLSNSGALAQSSTEQGRTLPFRGCRDLAGDAGAGLDDDLGGVEIVDRFAGG